MIYLTTDTHFNHKNIIKYCDRPIDYEKQIVDGFKTLSQEDTLIHLGDICIGNDLQVHEEIIVPIKAKKILVKGNHDPKSNEWYLRNGWDFVCTHFYDKFFGTKILFSHIPVHWDGIYDVNIHGHLHNMSHRKQIYTQQGINYLLSLEIEGYDLFCLRKICEKIMNMKKGKESYIGFLIYGILSSFS